IPLSLPPFSPKFNGLGSWLDRQQTQAIQKQFPHANPELVERQKRLTNQVAKSVLLNDLIGAGLGGLLGALFGRYSARQWAPQATSLVKTFMTLSGITTGIFIAHISTVIRNIPTVLNTYQELQKSNSLNQKTPDSNKPQTP
ncbi:MAG: hypothetical protein K2X66_18390, partial [Cyanobacteria bacterium]|nr:hypothetical protein [Cyanobacteriota bacterium]